MGGSQSVPKITKQDRAILDLKLQRDEVKKYQKKIQVVLDREHEIAKQQLAEGNRDRALVALRRRKYQQGLLVKTDTQLENLEQLVSTIEFSLVEVSVLHGLQQGNAALKEIHKELNIESVERILEETHEAREYQREIDDMLANSLTVEDEEAVQAELRQLQLESLAAQDAERPIHLPSVPMVEPASAVKSLQEPRTEPPAQEREQIPVTA